MCGTQKYRLVTRSDFDGLVCAVLLESIDLIDDILFVHPNDMQHGRVKITDTDITTNLPYVSGVHIAFDHHASEDVRVGKVIKNHINDSLAPSAARVVYEYYGGKEKFKAIDDDLMTAVDKADSAQFTIDEVMNPSGWALLNFITDPRTGLGRFREFRIPNYEFMMALIDFVHEHSIQEILQLPDVKERVEFYLNHQDKFIDQTKRCSVVEENLVTIDLRNEEIIFSGNRFLVYALFPDCNISMHIMRGRRNKGVIFALGKSIFNQNSKTNVGNLLLKYGGGGHIAAGTCQIDDSSAEAVQIEIARRVLADG
ncbi:MAG: exopolyphosphatase [Pseudomonadota bacterium]|nr:exopolyphosphatase [Pseudomonadota bacterium]